MNRLRQPPQLVEDFAPQALAGDVAPEIGSRRSVTKYSLFGPLHYEPNYAYPLIIWLHGPGGDENQLKRIAPLVSLRNYVVVGPRGASPQPLRGRGASGFTWLATETDIAIAEQAVFDSAEAAGNRFNIHSERIFLAGFGCGGTMAFRVAMNHPERFAGVLSLGGPFPRRRTPLRRLQEARRLPLFIACGRDSQSYPAAQVCEDLRLLHCAGMEVALRQYPCGQEITTEMLADLNRWVMERITSGRC